MSEPREAIYINNPTIAVHTVHGWADVIAIVRDLLGYSHIVWQDRTGMIGTMPKAGAVIRVSE